MQGRFRYLVLWFASGAVLWLCVHTMTLLFPIPGPWLPTSTAVPTGILMGLIGFFLTSTESEKWRITEQVVLWFLGMTAGIYLGWISARGPLVDESRFFSATFNQKLLSALVCGILGCAANAGAYWLIDTMAQRPLKLFGALVLLLCTFLAAVTVLVLFRPNPG